MTDLITRLEEAETGSRELDAAITAYFAAAEVRPYPPQTDFWASFKWQFWSEDGKHFLGNESKFPVYAWTTSISCAISKAKQVLPEMNCYGFDCDPKGAYAYVSRNNVQSGHWMFESRAKTPALAFCIATIRAYEAGK
jgi:hypothetical protein